MNNKKRFTFIPVIMTVLCLAFICVMIFTWANNDWREQAESSRGFHHLFHSPLGIVCIGFMAVMMILCIFFCFRSKNRWSNMCDWKGWRDRGPWEKEEEKNPVEILKARLAKGEISEQEYDRLIEKLK